MLTGLLHKVLYRVGFALAYVKDIPRKLELQYYEWKYGGYDKIPDKIKERHLEAHVKHIVNAPDFQFSVAVGMLHDKLSIPTETSMTFAMIHGYYHGNLQQQEDYDTITKMMHMENPRRAVFEYMRVMKDLTDHKLNYFFPEGEKREQLELWLDKRINVLP